MAGSIVMDEFHLTILASSNLHEVEYQGIKRSLNRKRLHELLRAAVLHVLHQYRALLKVRVRISR